MEAISAVTKTRKILYTGVDFNEIYERGKALLKCEEAECLYNTAMEIHAKNILEIGSCYGTSSMTLASVAKETGGHLQSIEAVPQVLWRQNMDEMGLSKYCTMIAGYSPWVDDRTINTPIDYLFIDGEHRTRWCLTDYQYWGAYVRIGGRIAFHDYTGANKAGKGVMRSVDIILEDDADCLKEIARIDLRISGLIIFEKIAFSPHTPHLGAG